MTNPIRPTDDEARALARQILGEARFGALATSDPDTGTPMVSRVSVVPGPDGLPLSLVSELAQHARALRADPACALLLGEPGTRGDPLTHPRISLQAEARFIHHGDPGHPALAAHFLERQPKAKLYIGFADFFFLRFDIRRAHLNGGFGKAFVLTPDDLAPAAP